MVIMVVVVVVGVMWQSGERIPIYLRLLTENLTACCMSAMRTLPPPLDSLISILSLLTGMHVTVARAS